MQLPREVIVGDKTLDLVWDICRRLGFSESVFVITGPSTFRIAGKRAVDSLADAGVNTDHLIVSSSTMWDVRAAEGRIHEVKPQVVLGIGGGTKIDVAKLSSARQGVPFISVPTTASHDGIASPVASIKGLHKPYSIMAQSPMAIIADTHVIAQAAHRLVASGCGDVLSKFTAVNDWRLAHDLKNEYYGDYAASLALMSAMLVVRNAEVIRPGAEEGVRIVLEALISCGVATSIAGSSRPCSGSAHLFSHALDVIAPNPALHGEQCGVGAVMMSYLHELNWRQIRRTLRKVGAPTTAEELGMEPEFVVQALVEAQSIRPERYTILEERRLDSKSAERLARATGIIK